MIVAESIGGQEWSEANTGTGQSVSDQQIPESIQDTSVSSSSQSPILSSSGYFSLGNTSTPYSHISENEVLEMNQSMNDQQIQDTSVSSSNEDEVFESNAFGDEEKHKQQGDELGDRIRELEQENTYFKGQNLALKSHNKKITEEGDGYILELGKSEKKVKELECRLKNKLAGVCEENKRLEQVVSALKENLQSKDDEAKSLHNLLKDRMSEIQSTNRANEELQKRLDQHETEISRLRAETTELSNDMKEIVEDLKDDHEEQLVGLLEREKKLTDTISQLDKKNQELVGELNELERGALEAKNLYPSSGMSLTDEMSDANKKLEQKESHQQVEKVDISTQTGIEYDSGDCNQETTPKNKVVDSDDFSLFAQGTSNRPECYELGQRNETDRVIDICVEHTLSDQSKIDDSDSDSKNEQKLEEKLSTEQEWSETNEPYDGEYELIKEEHLSQISCNDRLEILRKQGHSESDIDEICSHGDSWYTQTTIPTLDNKAPPSLMDSRDSLRKRVCVWLAQEYGLTENQKQLNIELLDILKHLDWYDESALFDYDNGGVVMLKEFLENNKNNPDLKVILDLERGESGATVLHAVSGARIYEIGRDHEHRAVGLLLAAGADPNAQDNEGETPLYYAAAIGNGEGVSSLLWKNANLNICNKQGKTPQQIAIDSGHHNVAGLLLTDKQKKLRDKLYYNIRANVSDLIHFTKILKEFLDEHKNNPDLKVVLNIRSERGESEVLEFAERISYFNGAVGAEVRNLFLEVGASCDVLYRVVKEERPFVLWRSLTLNQQKRLDDFLYRISKAEDMDKLEKVVDEVIRSGVQLNFNKDFSPKDPIACNWYSSTDYVIKRIGELNKLKRNPKVASDIICKLVSRGAILYNRNSMDVIDELELESKDHRANMKKAYADYINNAHKFIKVVKRATNGRLNDVRMDNSVFYLEYSEDSTINVAMITDEAQKNIQSGKNVIKIGNSVVEIITINGIRNYTDLEDNSDIALIFYTSQGELEVRLCPDMQNKGLIMVKVNNQDLLEQLKNCGEELGKNCLLGGLPVNEAIERGFFTRSGKLCQYSETVSSAAQTVNEKQQLLQDLRNIESNIVKKEKNFDIKTHLIDIFKTLSRFYEEKGDISKTDLAKAAEKESKKLGLESKYNWSKIFGLEEGVIEKAEKQGDKEQKSNIPDDFYLGHAINNGSCFFDSFRQSLEQQKGIKVTVEQLRNECKRFAQDNPPEWFISKIGNDFDEVEGEFVNHGITCNQYINSIGKNEFWGRSDIEGRVPCSKYGVKLHVAESNPLHTIDKQQGPFLRQLIDSSGSKAGKIDCNHNSVLHMVNGGHDHFQPLLYRNKVLAKQTQEQKDSLFYSSLPSCSMDELKIEKASHQHKALLVSRP